MCLRAGPYINNLGVRVIYWLLTTVVLAPSFLFKALSGEAVLYIKCSSPTLRHVCVKPLLRLIMILKFIVSVYVSWIHIFITCVLNTCLNCGFYTVPRIESYRRCAPEVASDLLPYRAALASSHTAALTQAFLNIQRISSSTKYQILILSDRSRTYVKNAFYIATVTWAMHII